MSLVKKLNKYGLLVSITIIFIVSYINSTKILYPIILILLDIYAFYTAWRYYSQKKSNNYFYLYSISLFVLLLAYINEITNITNIFAGIISLNIVFAIYITTTSILFSILNKKYQQLILKIFIFLFLFTILSTNLIMIFYKLNVHAIINEADVDSFLETNIKEAWAYINSSLNIVVFITTLIVTFAIYIAYIGFYIKKVGKKLINFNFKSSYIKICIFLLLLVVVVIVTNHKKTDKSASFSLIHMFKDIIIINDDLNNIKKDMNTKNLKYSKKKSTSGELYVVVIGESLNKAHMGLYGYFRNTTPNLSKMKKELIIQKNTISTHTHTTIVLSRALLTRNSYNNLDIKDSVTLPQIFNKAGFETFWISNQAKKGLWDNKIAVIAETSNYYKFFNKTVGKAIKTQYYDSILIKKLKDILKKDTNKNRVIFIHLMGNHAKYSDRYPQNKYSKYSGKLDQAKFGSESRVKFYESINSYDNSVLFNDFVVSQFIKVIKNNKTKIKGLIYISDHTDDVFDDLSHNSSLFTYDMIQIPFIMWFSDGYKKTYKKKYTRLKLNSNKYFTNDMLYDTIIGLSSVDTNLYSSKYDLSSSNYKMKPKELKLSVKNFINFTDKRNYIYYQEKYSKYIVQTNQEKRLIPHRIDSLGKLNDIHNLGLNSFEFDLIFHKKDKKFYVGHFRDRASTDLVTFLSHTDSKKVKKIRFDIKNLNKDNYKNILIYLNKIDKKYPLKNKIIFESGTTRNFYKYIRQDGWHTSYYLPTVVLLRLIKNKDAKALKEKAITISKQIKIQNVYAVSFDWRVYPFVKKYLEPLISKDVIYHTWDMKLYLYDKQFVQKLKKLNFYRDKRIKTILYEVKSHFSL